MSETLLQMNHIRKHFGDLHVLEDISIEVHRGECVFFACREDLSTAG